MAHLIHMIRDMYIPSEIYQCYSVAQRRADNSINRLLPKLLDGLLYVNIAEDQREGSGQCYRS